MLITRISYGGAGGFYIIPTLMINENYISAMFLLWHFTVSFTTKKDT